MSVRIGLAAALAASVLMGGCGCSGEPAKSLRITSPLDGARLTAADDEDLSSPTTIEFTVIAEAKGLEGVEAQLFPNADATDPPLATQAVSGGMVVFEGVSFTPGSYRLMVQAGTANSRPVDITVGDGGGCGAISFIDPTAGAMRVTMGPGEDTDGEACGATFETTVTVSTDAADGAMAQVFVNGTPRGTAVVSGMVARFDGVGLDNRGATPNTIEVEVVDGGTTCRESFPVPVFVDCEGVSCAITSPDTSSAYLSSSDDMSPAAGFQANFEVTSDSDAIGEPVRLVVDGDAGGALEMPAMSVGGGSVATFADVSLAEGRVTVQAECQDGAGNVTRSGLAEWIVDTIPCGVAITTPDAGRAMSPFTDADDVDSATAGIQVDAAATASGADCTESRLGVCAGIMGAPFSPLGGSDFSGAVTLDSMPMQQLCAEVRDAAGNVGRGTLDIVVRTMGPQLGFESPAADARFNAMGAGGATADLTPGTATCEVAIVVNCTDVGVPVTLERTSSGTMLPGGSADCVAASGLPAPFMGQATFASVSLPSFNDGSAVGITARQSADGLSGSAGLSLFSDCDAPGLSFSDPRCGDTLRPSTQDQNSAMPGFQYGVDVLNNNLPKPPVDLTIRQAGGGSFVSMASSMLPSGGVITTFTDANFDMGGALEMVACATDAAMNTFCTPACGVTVADLPRVTITTPADGSALDGSSPADCDPGTAGYQVRVRATVLDAADGSPATVTFGGASAMTTLMGGVVSACVDAADGRAVTVRVEVMDAAAGTGSAMVTVDVDTAAPAAGITDLAARVDNRRQGRVRFDWTAVDDSGFALASYELRCAGAPITTQAQWTAAAVRPTTTVPAAGGSAQFEVLGGFRPGEATHCVLRGTDAAGRMTPLGNSVDATVQFLQQEVTGTGTAQLGLTITPVGDVNGDMVDDVLVSAPVFFSGVTADSKALLYFGSAAGPPTAAGTEIIGNHFSFGLAATSVGDFNGDTRPDFAIAERGANGGNGQVFVFFGRPSGTPWPATIDLRSGGCPADLCFVGMGGFATFGWSLGAVDFNGDGTADLAVGAPFIGGNAGRVYILLGSAGFTPGTTFPIPLGASITPDGTQPAGFYVDGPVASTFLGTAVVSPGSFTGSAADDLAIGGSGRAPVLGTVTTLAGRPYPGAAVGLQQIATSSLSTVDSSTALGDVMSVLDYDGDGRQDVVAQDSTGSGRVFIYPGSASGFSAASRVEVRNDISGRTGDFFGRTMGLGWHPFLGRIGDLDGDGRDDLAVGAAQHGTQAAGLELYYGSSPIGSPRRSSPDALIQPTPTSPAVERTAACIGDIDGDGFDDLAVGDPSAGSSAGRFIFLY